MFKTAGLIGRDKNNKTVYMRCKTQVINENNTGIRACPFQVH